MGTSRESGNGGGGVLGGSGGDGLPTFGVGEVVGDFDGVVDGAEGAEVFPGEGDLAAGIDCDGGDVEGFGKGRGFGD